MGQKVNPTGLRIGVIKNWESRWYANDKDFATTLVEDYKLREFLLKTLAPAGVPKVEIERAGEYMYRVVNDDLGMCFRRLCDLIDALSGRM